MDIAELEKVQKRAAKAIEGDGATPLYGEGCCVWDFREQVREFVQLCRARRKWSEKGFPPSLPTQELVITQGIWCWRFRAERRKPFFIQGTEKLWLPTLKED